MLITDFLLRKISLGLSFFGIALLISFSIMISPQEVAIEQISEATIGKQVTVKGIVKSVFLKNNTLLFELFDSKKIKAVKFSPTKEEMNLIRENSFLEVLGTVERYKGQLEIVVDSVKKID